MINFIPKEQLEAAGKATIASHNLLQIDQKYRKKYNEAFNMEERYYLRTIRSRFVKCGRRLSTPTTSAADVRRIRMRC